MCVLLCFCVLKANMPVKSLRLLISDSAGLRRCRVVPLEKLDGVGKDGVGLTTACMGMPVYADGLLPASGLSTSGEVRIIPDLATVTDMPWYPDHKVALTELHSIPGTPWDCCPRSALKRVIDQLQQRYGVSLRVGFESEFLLLRPLSSGQAPPHRLVPVDCSVYCQSSAFETMAPVLDEMVDALEKMGIPIVQYHAESAYGQFEISTEHFLALEAVDKLLLTREAISGVARKHGLVASFLPKYFADQAGNGCHCHFSLWKDGVNITADALLPPTPTNYLTYPALSSVAKSFLAGVLKHLSAILPFTAASANSYARLAPSCWSGAFNLWGWDNREAPLRATAPPSGIGAVNIEYKAFDGTCNPYIGLAALIIAGMMGLAGNLDPPAPLQLDAGHLDDQQRAELGIAPLPKTLKAALQAYEADTGLHALMSEMLTPALLRAYLAVKHEDSRYAPDASLDTLVTRY